MDGFFVVVDGLIFIFVTEPRGAVTRIVSPDRPCRCNGTAGLATVFAFLSVETFEQGMYEALGGIVELIGGLEYGAPGAVLGPCQVVTNGGSVELKPNSPWRVCLGTFVVMCEDGG